MGIDVARAGQRRRAVASQSSTGFGRASAMPVALRSTLRASKGTVQHQLAGIGALATDATSRRSSCRNCRLQKMQSRGHYFGFLLRRDAVGRRSRRRAWHDRRWHHRYSLSVVPPIFGAVGVDDVVIQGKDVGVEVCAVCPSKSVAGVVWGEGVE